MDYNIFYVLIIFQSIYLFSIISGFENEAKILDENKVLSSAVNKSLILTLSERSKISRRQSSHPDDDEWHDYKVCSIFRYY
jgi:mRNA-degrading endonuclease YafQ of YafQ-DinJ toxin-antitoxin module